MTLIEVFKTSLVFLKARRATAKLAKDVTALRALLAYQDHKYLHFRSKLFNFIKGKQK